MDVNEIIHTAETNPPAPPLAELTIPPELLDYADEADPLVKAAWQIENQRSADWALQRIAECEAEAAEIDAQADEAIRRIEARREALKMKAERGAGFFRFKVADWAERNRATLLHRKRKSVDLIHGRIGWRKKAERLIVTDPAALEAWLLTQPVEAALYRMKVAPEMKAIQALYKDSGAIPPGCDVESESETLHIEATAPESALTKREG